MVRGHRRGIIQILFALVVIISISSLTIGFPNGTGDSKIGYGGCAVTGCHFDASKMSNATIEMWASNSTLFVDETVTVYVNVTSWTLSANRIIGVFLLRSLTADDTDVPSSDGWRILSDPNGGDNNFVQKTVANLGDTASFKWDLRAPFSSGTYTLYARVHHGGGAAFWLDDTVGMTFQVLPDISLKPDLALIDISYRGELRVGEETVFYATIYNDFSDDISNVGLDFMINDGILAQVRDRVIVGKGIRNITATWVPSESGNFTLRAVLDPSNEIDEIDESNNTLSLSFEVLDEEFHPQPRLEIVGLLLIILALFVASVAVLGLLKRGRKDEMV